jgi:hypothetical protein
MTTTVKHEPRPQAEIDLSSGVHGLFFKEFTRSGSPDPKRRC